MSRVRQRRSTWVGVVIVTVFLAGVTLAVAMVGGHGPGIPHSAGDDRAVCVTCHPTADLPDDHHDRVNDSCRSCHSEKSADAGGHSGGPRHIWHGACATTWGMEAERSAS